MNVKQRLTSFLGYLNISQSKFEESVGLSNGFVNNIGDSIRVKSMDKITTVYPELNTAWLLTGHGEMILKPNLVAEDSGTYITNAPKGRFPKKRDQDVLVPFYDIDFAAGDIEFYEGNKNLQPAYTMDIPEFNGCVAFRSYGDSMENLIKSGSIIFGTRIEDWKSHLEYGQIYGIICKDKRKYLKYIRKSIEKEETHFLLKSENPSYDEFTMPKSEIKSIWLIHGWINKRA